MSRRHRIALALVCLGVGWISAGAALAQASAPTLLTPVAQRTSDESIHADHQAYEAVQARLKAINERGVGQGGYAVNSYPLAKAQCWLDVSLHEYSRNDRSAFPQAALDESLRIIKSMESGPAAPLATNQMGWETPLVNDALRLREDLWAEINRMKLGTGWRCAQAQLACAEVELVHAGNEQRQQQWQHAKPYVQIAEDLVGAAKAAAASCPQPVAATSPATAPVALAPITAPAPKWLPLNLSAVVLFGFNQRDASGADAGSMAQLKAAVAQAQAKGVMLEKIALVGYADRLNGTGKKTYNDQLAADRAQAVKATLVQMGVDAKLISVRAKGSQDEVVSCAPNGKLTAKAVTTTQTCLAPNRRVEVTITAAKLTP